jgi:hypothetical protein
MPTSSEILASLQRIANEASVVAVVWHLVVGLAIVALAFGFRPSIRSAALSLSLPLASVAITAFFFGNPFNGAVFTVTTVVLTALAVSGSTAPIGSHKRWTTLLGLCLVAFGWLYPHFLVGRSIVAYLYASPLGILPCPTLALVCGATLWASGLVRGAWRLTLAFAAAFYALFGLLRLGVFIDAFLLLASAGLAFQHLQDRSRRLIAGRA